MVARRAGGDGRVARQLTTTAGAKSDVQFSPDSKEVSTSTTAAYQRVTLDRREVRGRRRDGGDTLDFAKEKIEVFDQAWPLLRDNFFDPGFNGVDWNAARRVDLPRIAGAGDRRRDAAHRAR